MTLFFRRLWEFVRPYQFRLILGLLFGVLYALTTSAFVMLSRPLVNLVLTRTASISFSENAGRIPLFARPFLDKLAHLIPQMKSPSSKLGMVLLILTLPAIMFLRGLFSYLNAYCLNWVAVRAIIDLRTKLFDHLQNLPLSFFSQARTGDLISRITSDTQMLQSIIGNAVGSMVKDPVTVAGLLIALFCTSTRLTLVSIIVLPICILPIVIYGRKVRKSGRAIQTHAAELSTLMHESFTGNRIIKAYNLEDAVLAQFRETTKKYLSHVMRVFRSMEIPSHLTEFLAAVGIALVLLYVEFRVPAKERPTPGDFAAFIGSIFLMYGPLKNLTRLHSQLHQAAAASERIFAYLAQKSDLVDPPNPVPIVAVNADIHFDHIDFAYGEKAVLQGINLTVKAGQMVALVGSSGSGKTTLTNLLLRFYDPQRGTVRIGSTDIRQVAIKDLRRQIALVAQETILFNDTIRRNIALGRPGGTDANIEAAARHAYAHEFILDQPQGYETMVGEKGMAVSGGQRQRIAIARALVKDAPILVLDEAMSALDSESERVVQAALDELMKGRTTICIAHRLSTIQKADLIVVLSGGRIVETGSHAELLKARGNYCKLYELQFEPHGSPEVARG